MSFTRKLLQIAGLAVAAASFAAIAATNETSVSDRLKPAGSLCMAGEECAAAGIASADTGPRSGQQVYEGSCASCHGTGVAGAPTFGDAAEWSDRLASKGLDTLHDNAWNGINAMPPKGLCMDCTREELDAAVDYILENSQ